MKKTIPLLTLAVCLLVLPLTAHAQKIEIAAFNYPPFMDINNPHGGVLGEIIHAAFKEVGIDPEIIYFPPLRMLNLYIGANDFLACMGPVTLIHRQPPEKRSQVIYIPPIANIGMYLLYHLPTHGTKPMFYEKLSALRGYRVGVIRGSNTIPILRDKGIEIVEIGVESQMRMLKAGRLDYCVIGYLTGIKLIASLFPGNEADFAFMKTPVMELPASIYFNKGFPRSGHYAEEFKKGLRAIVINGRYVQILEKYYGKNNIPNAYKTLFDALGAHYTFKP